MELELPSGHVVLFDAADWPTLSEYKWYYNPKNRYAIGEKHWKGKRVLMQRLVMGVADNLDPHNPVVFHTNGNRLDNRRSNLELISKAEAKRRSPLQHNSKSGVRGISWHQSPDAKVGGWQVAIAVAGRQIYLGKFRDKEEAVKIYAEAARKYFGEPMNLS